MNQNISVGIGGIIHFDSTIVVLDTSIIDLSVYILYDYFFKLYNNSSEVAFALSNVERELCQKY